LATGHFVEALMMNAFKRVQMRLNEKKTKVGFAIARKV